MKTFLSLLSLPILLAASLSSNAAQTNGDFDVSATVARACTITQLNNLNFGTYDPVTANSQGNHIQINYTMSVKCTAGMAGVTLDLGRGQNPNQSFSCNSPSRHLVGPGGNLMRYHFYGNPERSRFWGCTQARVGNGSSEVLETFTDSLNAKTLSMPALLVGGSDVPAGNYSDTINVTVTF